MQLTHQRTTGAASGQSVCRLGEVWPRWPALFQESRLSLETASKTKLLTELLLSFPMSFDFCLCLFSFLNRIRSSLLATKFKRRAAARAREIEAKKMCTRLRLYFSLHFWPWAERRKLHLRSKMILQNFIGIVNAVTQLINKH